MERAGPFDRIAGDLRTSLQRCRADALDATRHLGGHPAGEGEKKNAPRISAVQDEVSDAVRERAGLARAGAGDDEQRRRRSRRSICRDAEDDGRPLRRIELVEIGHDVCLRRLRVNMFCIGSSGLRPDCATAIRSSIRRGAVNRRCCPTDCPANGFSFG